MHFFNWLFGGIIGGAIGAAAWVGIEYATNSEYGWIAWPVGLLVGVGVRKGASADIRGGFFRGAVAALLALAAVMGAKYSLAKVMTMQAEKAAEPAKIAANVSTDARTVETTKPSGATNDIQEVLRTDTAIMKSRIAKKSGSAFNELDMLWLCLSAFTAYIVGKGSGASSLPTEEGAAAKAAKQTEQPTADEPSEE